jgi:hypothetical protein
MPPKAPKDDYERWLGAAEAVARTDNPLKVPYDVALQEAAWAADFVTKYWEPTNKLPGLQSVKKRLPKAIAEEIPSLVAAVQLAQTRLILLVDPIVANKGERARFVAGEIESAIEFLLDDGIEEPADTQLAQLKEFHSQDGQRSSALAQRLRDYGTLARQLKDRLVEVDEDFEPALIDEAFQLADELSKAPPAQLSASSAEAQAATRTRNCMLVLLTQRVSKVRSAAGRVFRNHPEILREATSTYERRRRAAARRAKLKEEQEKKKDE